MEVKAGPPGQPVADPFGLVGAVVVQNKVDVEFWRDVLLDGSEGCRPQVLQCELG